MFHKMSTRSQLTKDLNESVKSLLGKQIKILLKNVVKLETKGDKTENRVLVFSPCRLFLLTAKVPSRIDVHFHYLEIQAIESKRPNRLSLTLGEKVYNFLTIGESEDSSHDVDAMLLCLATALQNIFPSIPITYIIRRIEVQPFQRIETIFGLCENARGGEGAGHTNLAPCGGFSTQYACMCDFHNVPYREEVAWDVDTIYLSQDTNELSLKDFEHLDAKDLVAIISALEYNTWFRKIRASQIKLTHDTLDRLLHVLKKNRSLEELYLDNLSLRSDFAQKLANAILANQFTPVHTIDLSNNLIEDKGANHIGMICSKLPKGVTHLSLAHCGLTSKGVNNLANALALNSSTSATLTHLNLSENNLKEEINNLCNLLAQPNVLTYLDISSTDCVLEALFGALLRGCATNLSHLNVSRNCFSTKKNKEVPPSFKQFFTSTLSLKYLNISYCKLPLEALKNLLLGLACNESTVDLALDISCNNLGSQGAHVLESCIHGVRCISSLDISDNSLDVDLAGVIGAISKNKSIKHLQMGKSMGGHHGSGSNMKAKHIAAVMEAMVQMVQDEDCVLQSLMLPDSRLKSDMYNLINALGSNSCLHTIDMSGNFIGDGGARLLAKALQINTRLRTIYYDRNNITLQGYCDIAYALESNYTVRYMPFPIHDVLPCMKTNAEKTDAVMKKIQQLLNRNVTPKKYSNGQAFRLQQGFLLSSTQQMVDKLIVQTQDCIRSISDNTEACNSSNEINSAKALIHDADNSKHLLSRLHEVASKREDLGNSFELKLRNTARDLHSSIVNYLQGTLENMLQCAEDECPHLLTCDNVVEDIRRTCREKSFVPFDFVETCILDQAGTDLINRINELNLAMAAYVSDRITDEVIDQLSKVHKFLLADSNRKRASTPDVLRSGSRVSSNEDHSDNCSITDQSPLKLEYLNLATPHLSSKKKSLHGRKLRPKSVVDHVDGLSADHIPDLLPTLQQSAEESLDSVTELPTQQLQHLVKSRPKRVKTRQPTRPMLPESLETADLDSGLDTFFRPDSATPSLVSPTSDESESTFPTLTSPTTNNTNKVTDRQNLSPLPPRSQSTDNLESSSTVHTVKSSLRQISQEKDDDTSSGSTLTDGNSSLPMSPSAESKKETSAEAGIRKSIKLKRGVPPVAPKPRPRSLTADNAISIQNNNLQEPTSSLKTVNNDNIMISSISEMSRDHPHRRTTGSMETKSVRELAASINSNNRNLNDDSYFYKTRHKNEPQ